MKKRVFRYIFLTVALVLLSCFLLIVGFQYKYFADYERELLQSQLSTSAKAVEQQGLAAFDDLQFSNYRLTWVAADGDVLYDSDVEESELDNHADREEIIEAFADGSGESSRYSSTLTERTLYLASQLSDGTVLRASLSYASIWVMLLTLLKPMILVIVLALILSIFLARKLSKRIAEPLNTLDLEHPMENNSYDEIAPLLLRIDSLHKELKDQMSELQKKTNEFNQITRNMQEGLVLLNNDGQVISINPAAISLWNTSDSCVGQDFLTIDRSRTLRQTIEHAVNHGHSELKIEKNGLVYQLDISRIRHEHQTVGVVMIAFDVTEKVFAEKNRREFTANVSHELKTPLHSIMGSAELLENGLVKEEDAPRFIGRIRTEATRLVSLIEDIIRLSGLDEGNTFPVEDVDLYEIAKETIDYLKGTAEDKQMELSLTGSSVVIQGVPRLLTEIISNLCENAIKYNHIGGTVRITVSQENNQAILCVEDDGIGIPKEHQNRVFERFYRVDKSHSKETGGTGLGLSIVKHAVEYHHGQITLESEVNKGTIITVTLPLSMEA